MSLAESALHHVVSGVVGPPVLLLHGLGSCAADWSWQSPALEPRYRVIAVDLPGHGGSPLPSPDATVETIADTVAPPVGGPPPAPAHGVRLSLGACVTRRPGLHGTFAVCARTP